MAARPWITPKDVKDYTELPKVSARSDPKLLTDIIRAENYIIIRTNNKFDDAVKYPDLPPEIKLAAILVAEFYANKTTTAPTKQYQSESFKDYSYTIKTEEEGVDAVDIDSLIAIHILPPTKGTLNMKLRKL